VLRFTNERPRYGGGGGGGNIQISPVVPRQMIIKHRIFISFFLKLVCVFVPPWEYKDDDVTVTTARKPFQLKCARSFIYLVLFSVLCDCADDVRSSSSSSE